MRTVGAPNWQTVVLGAGVAGPGNTWLADELVPGWTYDNGYSGSDIVTFVGNNGFTVNGGFWLEGPFQINVLGQGIFNAGTIGRSNGNNPTAGLTVNTVVGSTLVANYNGLSYSSSSQTVINGGGTVNFSEYYVRAPTIFKTWY